MEHHARGYSRPGPESALRNAGTTANATSANATRVAPQIKTERLPFTVRKVTSEVELRKAVKVRQAAYARHVPEFAASLGQPEAADFADDGIVLLAESKLDGAPLGSIRIRTNLQRPLDVEKAVTLPEPMKSQRLVEAVRLGVEEGRMGRVVKMALIKACFMYCRQHDIDWSVLMARPGVDRQYEQLMFVDVFPDAPPFQLAYAGNLPHRLMAFELETFEERWTEAKHPLLDFFFYTRHPDIDIGTPEPVDLTAPRKPAPAQPARPADTERPKSLHFAAV